MLRNLLKIKTTRPSKILAKQLSIKECLMLRENQNQLIHVLGERDNWERDRDSNTILLLWNKIRDNIINLIPSWDFRSQMR